MNVNFTFLTFGKENNPMNSERTAFFVSIFHFIVLSFSYEISVSQTKF